MFVSSIIFNNVCVKLLTLLCLLANLSTQDGLLLTEIWLIVPFSCILGLFITLSSPPWQLLNMLLINGALCKNSWWSILQNVKIGKCCVDIWLHSWSYVMLYLIFHSCGELTSFCDVISIHFVIKIGNLDHYDMYLWIIYCIQNS